jgi:hypothetical protein
MGLRPTSDDERRLRRSLNAKDSTKSNMTRDGFTRLDEVEFTEANARAGLGVSAAVPAPR